MADESKTGADAPATGGEKADPATVFAALAEIIYQGSDVNQMYAAICVAATLIVPGCDHASLLVRENDRYVTVGASDRLAQHIDDLERRAGDGPCIDAIEEETPQIDTGPDHAEPVAQAGGAPGRRDAGARRDGISAPGRQAQRRPRSTCSATRRTCSTPSPPAGPAVLASFASVAINAIAKGEDAASLRRGLLSNREIGKAVGMLMMLHSMSEDEAFDVLRRHSQELNIKLADVARAVIDNRGKLPFGEDQLSAE